MTARAKLIALLLAAVAAGCGAVPQLGPGVSPSPDESFNAVWDAAIEVLRQYRFEVDRADRRAGVITTLPMLGQSWFEFWRQDAATPADLLESSLQTIYRQATVNIRRVWPETTTAPVVGEYVAAVEVRVRRSDRLEPQATSASEAYRIFLSPGALIPEPGEAGGSEPTGGVADLGSDPKLAKILQDKITALAAKKLTIYPRQ